MRSKQKRLSKSGGSYLIRCQMKPLRLTLLFVIVLLSYPLARFTYLFFAIASAEAASSSATIPKAIFGDTASVQATGRGNPAISLADGRDLITSYAGTAELSNALQQNAAEPLSMASADFDEDGVPDLISGYAHSGSGIISWLRGNIDSIYANSPEAQQRKAAGESTAAPFLSPARLSALAIEPEFLGAGDFDADGHRDLVAASRKSDALYVLLGDGRGWFKEMRRISLQGVVTAFITGEVNRRDGLDDVVVAINSRSGPKALVFEGPHGAIRANPEIFDLPTEASAFALGQLDDDHMLDLAVASGRELIVIHGRDRKLSWDEKSRAEVSPANISRRILPVAIRSIVTGDFSGNQETDIALLSEDGALRLLAQERGRSEKISRRSMKALISDRWPMATALVRARVSGFAKDDLLVMESTSRQLRIVAGGAYKADSTGVLKRTSADGLRREAVSLAVEGEPVAVLPMRLNVDALSDLMILRSGHSNPAALLTIGSNIVNVNSNTDVLDGNTASIPDLIIFPGADGVMSLREIITAANNTPGTDEIGFNIEQGLPVISPTSPLPEITDPITIDGTTQPDAAADTPGIVLDGSKAGTGDAINGLRINTQSSTVRGLASKNFDHFGISIAGKGNQVEGCFIDSNGSDGVNIGFADENIIGGTVAAARNIISRNGDFGGIVIASSPRGGNHVMGNFIGTDASGAAGLGNRSFAGVFISRGAGNTIGGATAGAGNVVSGNANFGIWSNGFDTKNNLVQGNFIGTDAKGTAALGNGSGGVLVSDTSNDTIGGTTAGAGNLISSNGGNGVTVNATPETRAPLQSTNVQGNFISLNRGHGVALGAFSNILGIRFGAGGCLVEGNFIGTDAAGNGRLGNAQDGVFIENKSFEHKVINNTIAFNGRNGICIPNQASNDQITGGPGKKNRLSQNSMYSNALLGIDLAEAGVTDNDSRDTDDGANTVQNFPVLTSAVSDNAEINVQGSLNSTPNETFTIEFFSNQNNASVGIQPSAAVTCFPQGQTFIGSIIVRTDANGNASITITFPGSNLGGFINATATSSTGNTSELSSCVQPVINSADLSIVEAAPSSVVAGGDLIYQVAISNSGPLSASNLVLTAEMPAGTTFQSFTAPRDGGWTSQLPNVGGTGDILCSTSALSAGASASFTIAVKVDPAAPDGTFITNTILISSATNDANQGNNTVTATTTVTKSASPPPPSPDGADVSLALSGSPASLKGLFADDNINYKLNVINNGPAAAKDVTVRITVPVSTTYQSSDQPSGWSRTAPQEGGAGEVVYTNTSLGAGAAVSFNVVVKVKAETAAGTVIICTASVSSLNDTTANNFSRVEIATIKRPSGPIIQSVAVTSQIVVSGSGFIKPVLVFIEREGEPASRHGFSKPAKVKGGNKLTQKGKLDNGMSIEEMVLPGKTVLITFRNEGGSQTIVRFRN